MGHHLQTGSLWCSLYCQPWCSRTSVGLVRCSSPACLSAPAASCPVPQVARHGNMIVGKTGSGKTEAWKCLQRALLRLKKEEPDDERFQRVHVHTINPLALSNDELYGCFEEATHEWQVGRELSRGAVLGMWGGLGALSWKVQGLMAGEGPRGIVQEKGRFCLALCNCVYGGVWGVCGGLAAAWCALRWHLMEGARGLKAGEGPRIVVGLQGADSTLHRWSSCAPPLTASIPFGCLAAV